MNHTSTKPARRRGPRAVSAPAGAAATATQCVRVHYPAGARIALRVEPEWDRDLAPTTVTDAGTCHQFELRDDVPHRYLKAVLRDGDAVRWAQGENVLFLRGTGPCDVYPHFAADSACHECTEHHLSDALAAPGHTVRVFLPPGYDENPLARYPTLYMQDGQNAFFAHEAFGGRHWGVRETLAVLDRMSLVQRTVVVAVYPRERMHDYTAPGYDAYARFLSNALVPWVDARYRTRRDAAQRAVIGSSLGGVAALHAAWRHPEVFGGAACLSSTFGFRDDLFARVASEPRPPLRVYLDSGWPRDNYEATRAMQAALRRAGARDGTDVVHLAFPYATHDEGAWGARLHLPLRFLFGA